MKHLILSLLFLAFLSVGIQAQSRLDLKSKPITDELLVTILNLSQMKELKPPHPTEHNFFLRLYSLDDMSNNEDSSLEYCTPGVETEVTCGFRYFLAVHDGSLGVSGVVYDLGQVGEITKIKWLKSLNSNFDRLRLEVTNYPAHAFKLNPKLVRATKNFELTVNMNSLEIKELK
jgi:hypothetical protein